MQSSQRELVRAANEITRANVGDDATRPATELNQATEFAPIEQSAATEPRGDISEPLVELRRQELLFNASAKVVSTADKTLGSLLDTLA